MQPESQTDDARLEAWGTTTEIYPEGCSEEDFVTIDDATKSTLEFSFVTEGSPPYKVFEQLMRMGVAVKCNYQSLKVCYGIWDQGRDECSFRSLI